MVVLGGGAVSYEQGTPVERQVTLRPAPESFAPRHVGPCLGSYDGPRRGALSYERGTPVLATKDTHRP